MENWNLSCDFLWTELKTLNIRFCLAVIFIPLSFPAFIVGFHFFGRRFDIIVRIYPSNEIALCYYYAVLSPVTLILQKKDAISESRNSSFYTCLNDWQVINHKFQLRHMNSVSLYPNSKKKKIIRKSLTVFISPTPTKQSSIYPSNFLKINQHIYKFGFGIGISNERIKNWINFLTFLEISISFTCFLCYAGVPISPHSSILFM